MRAAVVENGTVVNVIEVEALDALPDLELIEAGSANIGDSWDGASFSPPAPEVQPADLSETDTTWSIEE